MHGTKAGNFAKITVQLQGHQASQTAVDELTEAKKQMDADWQALGFVLQLITCFVC